MTAQDDARETEMRNRFNLEKAGGRHDVDAFLELNGASVPEQLRGTKVEFELKSTTKGRPDISTVRDFGLHYIQKWSTLHWLFGIYDTSQTLVYCLYGPPSKMKPWFDEKAAYIRADVELGRHVPELITDATLTAILGPEADFGREQARSLMKNQFKADAYAAAADLPGGRFSRKAMLELLRLRCGYVIGRGSTLNNPHIPASYFDGWEKITKEHASRLRELVVEELSRQAAVRLTP